MTQTTMAPTTAKAMAQAPDMSAIFGVKPLPASQTV